MKKILLIAYRDFIIRIRNKTFLLSTLLLPIGIVLFYGTIFFFTSNDTDTHKIGIVDKNNYLVSKLKNEDNFIFKPISESEFLNSKSLRDSHDITALLIIPESKEAFLNGQIEVFTYTKLGIMTKSKLETIIQKIIETERFAGIHIEQSKIDEIQKNIKMNFKDYSGREENNMRESVAYGLSFLLGIMMYIILTIYGSQVMRGVMEEKTNRIVEIIISSVKPFELLMGKIIGIGLVSFVQLSVWGLFLVIANFGLALFLGVNDMTSASATSSIPMNGMASQIAQNPEMISAIKNIQSFNFIPIILCFLYYFLGGYFLYSAMFAAVGSAVGDDPQDVQSLMMPIMLPIFLSFVFLSKSINNPNGTEAIVSSLVPFTSPVVMMSRVVFGIPVATKYAHTAIDDSFLYLLSC